MDLFEVKKEDENRNEEKIIETVNETNSLENKENEILDDKGGKLEFEYSKKIEKRKEKVKNWLKDKNNLIFLGILILAILIRIYFFNLTKSQPVWWDESDYLAYAKNLAGAPTTWIITDQHSSIFPYLIAFFFKIGAGEATAKFFLEFLPSILLVIITYKICLLLYKDKRIALISSFLMATFWAILFNTFRFHLGIPALFVGYLAIYIFWQGYERKEKIFGKINPKWAIPITVFLVVLTYSIRRAYFLFGLFFLFYMIFTKRFNVLLKNKFNWIGLVIALILVLLVEKFIFIASIAGAAGRYFADYAPFSLIPFDVFDAYFKNIFNPTLSPLFYLFWIGLIVLIFNLIFHFGYFKKSERNEFRSDLFVIINIFVVLGYFLLIQRRVEVFGEARWYFPLLLGAFIAISRGSLLIVNFIRKYSKVLSLLVLVVLIGFGGYHEIKHGDFIIKNKLTSYTGIKQAGIFLKEYSNPEDIIISIPLPQPSYYAERTAIHPRMLSIINKPTNLNISLEEFISAIRDEEKVRFVIVTFSEPGHPDWMNRVQYVQNPQTGQPMLGRWEIPFMETSIDFASGAQDIKQTKTYDDITFNLLTIQQDAFVYEIVRS